jgi:hypothetical protein
VTPSGGGETVHGPTMKFETTHHSPELRAWNVEVDTERASRTATAAINWHPNWHAIVDGVETATRMSGARRVQFDIPAGAKQVTMEFRRSARENMWNVLSLATLVFVLVAWRRERTS